MPLRTWSCLDSAEGAWYARVSSIDSSKIECSIRQEKKEEGRSRGRCRTY